MDDGDVMTRWPSSQPQPSTRYNQCGSVENIPRNGETAKRWLTGEMVEMEWDWKNKPFGFGSYRVRVRFDRSILLHL